MTHLLIVFIAKLLRLRKNLPTTFPVAIAQEKWEQLVAPLFSPDQIVEQSLVDIRAGKFIASLNQELRNNKAGADGSSRPTNRLGIYLADDDYGLLVTDMTNFDSKIYVLCSLKIMSADKLSRRCWRRSSRVQAKVAASIPLSPQGCRPLPPMRSQRTREREAQRQRQAL